MIEEMNKNDKKKVVIISIIHIVDSDDDNDDDEASNKRNKIVTLYTFDEAERWSTSSRVVGFGGGT